MYGAWDIKFCFSARALNKPCLIKVIKSAIIGTVIFVTILDYNLFQLCTVCKGTVI